MSSSPWDNSRALLSGNPRARPSPKQSLREGDAVAVAGSGIDRARELTLYSQGPGCVVAVSGRCMIHVCVNRATSTTISLVRRALADLAERYDTFGFLCVIEQGAPITLPADLRESVNAYVRRYSPRFSGAAIVFEAPGFQATVVRSLVTAVNLASRASHPTKVFGDLRTGCNWLCRLTPGEPTAPRLFELTNQLRKTE
ncbi:MAG: hypothetical protein ABI895_03190 [Deltaproteobacteria bacterium]